MEKTGDEWKAEGNKAFGAGDFATAVACFTSGVAQDPTNRALYSNRSAAYARTGDYASALADAEKCIEIAPTWVKGYARKGHALTQTGDIMGAMAAFEKGLEVAPEDKACTTGMQEVRAAANAQSQNMMNNIFGPDMLVRLSQDPRTAAFMGDAAFVEQMKLVQSNPQQGIQLLQQDPRFQTCLSVLLNLPSTPDVGGAKPEPVPTQAEEKEEAPSMEVEADDEESSDVPEAEEEPEVDEAALAKEQAMAIKAKADAEFKTFSCVIISPKGTQALSSVCISPRGRVLARQVGGISTLVDLLSHSEGEREGETVQEGEDDPVQLAAAGCLINLSVNARNKEAILAAGGVPPLVSLLADTQGGSDAMRVFALRALCNLCLCPGAKASALACGVVDCIPPLLAYTGQSERETEAESDTAMPKYAARLCAALFIEDSDTASPSDPLPSEYLSAIPTLVSHLVGAAGRLASASTSTHSERERGGASSSGDTGVLGEISSAAVCLLDTLQREQERERARRGVAPDERLALERESVELLGIQGITQGAGNAALSPFSPLPDLPPSLLPMPVSGVGERRGVAGDIHLALGGLSALGRQYHIADTATQAEGFARSPVPPDPCDYDASLVRRGMPQDAVLYARSVLSLSVGATSERRLSLSGALSVLDVLPVLVIGSLKGKTALRHAARHAIHDGMATILANSLRVSKHERDSVALLAPALSRLCLSIAVWAQEEGGADSAVWPTILALVMLVEHLTPILPDVACPMLSCALSSLAWSPAVCGSAPVNARFALLNALTVVGAPLPLPLAQALEGEEYCVGDPRLVSVARGMPRSQI
ncbi:hypothetical protein KIPB_001117 [Kipferlia bialata]|uniref:Protein unc-45 homolog B n=1 Tax=Kipferlia bialata TaxID=797122 RepID=A0A9K3GF13_9EUKA|nr:hypothetical protein KIPB_001117 [Kipferlia bialata]|eukprot:g1117.t1